MTVDRICIVGDGPADALLSRIARGPSTVRRNPNADDLRGADLVIYCPTARPPDADELRRLETQMTHGAILACYGAGAEVASLAASLHRPDQFLALALRTGTLGQPELVLTTTETTAPGVHWAVRVWASALGLTPVEAEAASAVRQTG